MGWDKVFSNHMSMSGLISKIYKEFLQLKQQNNPGNLIKKWAKTLNRQDSEEGIQMANNDMK